MVASVWTRAALGGAAGWGMGLALGVVPLTRGLLPLELRDLALGALSLAMLPGLPAALASALFAGDDEASSTRAMVIGATLAAVVAELAPALAPPPFSAPGSEGAGVAWAGLFLLLGTLAHHRVASSPGASVALAVGPALTLLALNLPPSAPARAFRERGPEIVLVTVDALRADRLAPGHPATPNLQALAGRGRSRAAAVTPALRTGPALRAVLTGEEPVRSGVFVDQAGWEGEGSVVADLQRAGYRTGAAVGAASASSALGFAAGFDAFDDDLGWLPGARALPLGRLFTLGWPPEVERSAGRTVSRALKWWARPGQGPRFLWVHLAEPHPPYRPPPPFDARFYGIGDPQAPGEPIAGGPAWHGADHRGVTDPRYAVARYDGEVAVADAAIGRLIEGVGPEARVIVLGLYGQALGERGLWWTHDGLADATLRVPWIEAGPGVAPGVVEAPEGTSGLAATLKAWALPEAPAFAPAPPRAAWLDADGHRWLAAREAVRWVAVSDAGAESAWLVPASGEERELPGVNAEEAGPLRALLAAGPPAIPPVANDWLRNP